VAAQESLVGESRDLGRRADMRKGGTERYEVEGGWVVCRGRKMVKERAIEGCDFLYLAKAARGRARALPDAGGRGSLMQACRLVVYYYINIFKQNN
jgi:hypothetical protein